MTTAQRSCNVADGPLPWELSLEQLDQFDERGVTNAWLPAGAKRDFTPWCARPVRGGSSRADRVRMPGVPAV